MFGNRIDKATANAGRNRRSADRRRKRRVAMTSEISRRLRIEPLENRLLLASDFNFADASAAKYLTGDIVGFVTTADLDDNPATAADLVVANDYSSVSSRSSGLSILRNNGEGVFSQQPIDLPSNSRPQSVDVKDVDGINGNDLVVAAIGVRQPGANGELAPAGDLFVILNNGDGTFASPTRHAVGGGPIDVVAANLDGQGRLDYVTANFRSNDVSVLTQASGGMTSSRLPVGDSPVSVAVGTIDGDAHLDLAVANIGSHDISLFRGDGQGGFTPTAGLDGLDGPSDLLLDDIDHDGDTDLLVVNSGSGQVSVFLNDGAGSLELHAETSVAGAETFALGDLNHDGLDDLLVTSASAGAVSTLTNLGGGDFTLSDTTVLDAGLCSGDPGDGDLLRTTCNPSSVVAAQLNADGDIDVAVADAANAISVYLNDQAASITGRKFEDLNGDGDGAGDPGLGGVQIDLYFDANSNSQFEPGTDHHVTSRVSAAGTGGFLFGQVAEGTHFLVEQPLAGSTQTAPFAGQYTVFTQPGLDITGQDFGNVTRVDISGRKFNDINGDGDDENGGDPGLGGITIELYRDSNGNGTFQANADVLVATRTTAAGSGAYSFPGNDRGTYFVAEQVPAGFEQTAPASGVYTVVAQIGTEASNLDFGNHFTNVAISGRKFDDRNGDGDDENGGDPGRGGVTIELYRDNNGNGTFEANSDVLVATTTTSFGSGAYSFPSNAPGQTYFVLEQVPAGSTQTAPAGGVYTVFAQSGVNVPNQDFGNFSPIDITISGRKFDDLNGDGDDENGGEPGLGGVTIELFRDDNGNGILETNLDTLVGTTVTIAQSGAYSFAGNAPGVRYFVREVVPAGSTQTAPPGGFYSIFAQSGVDVPNQDFGNTVDDPDTITISGRKFNDINGDGDDENGGDPGQGGVIIELYRDANGNGTFEANADTLVGMRVTTAGSGAYSFASNDVGETYFVIEQVPAGSTQTAPAGGVYTIFAQSGVDVPNQDFGNVGINGITISGRKFNDVNGNGNDDNGSDAGQGGVTIELYRDDNGNGTFEANADVLVGTRTTAVGSGAYSFAGNIAGETYFVLEQVPAGSTQTAPAGGLYTIFAQSGVDVPNQDFGNFFDNTGGLIARDDFFDVTEATSNNLLDVLANDTTGPATPVRIVAVGSAVRGTVTFTDNFVFYTPTAACGMDQFTYTVADANDVQQTATVTVDVQPDNTNQDVRFCLQVFGPSGNPIASVPQGGQFDLLVTIQDIRLDNLGDPVVDAGVAAAWLDVIYDSDLVSTDGVFTFGPAYGQLRSGSDNGAGLIDEAGGFQTQNPPLGSRALDLWSLTFTANQPGFTTFLGEPADATPFHDVLIYEPPAPVPDALQQFVNASIQIISGQGEGEATDVNADGSVTPLDALLVVNELNENGSRQVGSEGEGRLSAAKFDTNRDGFVTPVDALLVINQINSEIGAAEGEQADHSNVPLPAAQLVAQPSGESSQSLIAGLLPPTAARSSRPTHIDSARTNAKDPTDRRAEAPSRQAAEHDLAFAAWKHDSDGRAAAQIDPLLASDLATLEVWGEMESSGELF